MLGLLENLDFSELLIVLLAAILIFGKNLPRVAGQVGVYIGKARRAFDKLWRESGVERELRDAQREIQQAIPRDLSLGEMARLASKEMEQRMRADEAAARAEGVPAAPAAPVAPVAPPAKPASGAPAGPTALGGPEREAG